MLIAAEPIESNKSSNSLCLQTVRGYCDWIKQKPCVCSPLDNSAKF